MTSIERIEQLLAAEEHRSDKDAAGIIVAQRVDASVRRKAIEECLRILKSEETKVKA